MSANSQFSPTPELGACNTATQLKPPALARLVPFEECREMVGFRSRTSLYAAMKEDSKFPNPVYRGRSVFFFEDELIDYLEKLRAQRDSGAQAQCIEAAKKASRTAIVGKIAKRVASGKGGAS